MGLTRSETADQKLIESQNLQSEGQIRSHCRAIAHCYHHHHHHQLHHGEDAIALRPVALSNHLIHLQAWCVLNAGTRRFQHMALAALRPAPCPRTLSNLSKERGQELAYAPTPRSRRPSQRLGSMIKRWNEQLQGWPQMRKSNMPPRIKPGIVSDRMEGFHLIINS